MGRQLRALCWLGFVAVAASAQQRASLVRVVDLNAGESAEVELADGSKARVKLLSVSERRDTLRA